MRFSKYLTHHRCIHEVNEMMGEWYTEKVSVRVWGVGVGEMV